MSEYNWERLEDWALALQKENNPLGISLMLYVDAWEKERNELLEALEGIMMQKGAYIEGSELEKRHERVRRVVAKIRGTKGDQ